MASWSDKPRARARDLRAKGKSWTEIALALMDEYKLLTPLAAMRLAHDKSQGTVARDLGTSEARVQSHESWRPGVTGGRPSDERLLTYAAYYECDVSLFFFGVGEYADRDEYAGPVNRRDLVLRGGAALLGVAAPPISFASLVAAATQGNYTIGMADVERLREEVWAIDDVQAREGGAATYTRAAAHLEGLHQLIADANYGEDVGRELYGLLSLAHLVAAFGAFDVSSHETARAHWNEAVNAARVAGNEAYETWAWAQMANQATQLRQGRHAVHLARTAIATARNQRSSQLWAFLEVRLAAAQAAAGDMQAAHRALGRSEDLVVGGQGDDDERPAWLGRNQWRHPADWQLCAVLAFWLGGAHRQAIEMADQVATDPGTLGPVSQALVAAWRARALGDAGELDGAAKALTLAAGRLDGLRSPRVVELLRGAKPVLQPHAQVTGVDEALAALERV